MPQPGNATAQRRVFLRVSAPFSLAHLPSLPKDSLLLCSVFLAHREELRKPADRQLLKPGVCPVQAEGIPKCECTNNYWLIMRWWRGGVDTVVKTGFGKPQASRGAPEKWASSLRVQWCIQRVGRKEYLLSTRGTGPAHVLPMASALRPEQVASETCLTEAASPTP